eukprot:4303472-Amphidinium_carterae.1
MPYSKNATTTYSNNIAVVLVGNIFCNTLVGRRSLRRTLTKSLYSTCSAKSGHTVEEQHTTCREPRHCKEL